MIASVFQLLGLEHRLSNESDKCFHKSHQSFDLSEEIFPIRVFTEDYSTKLL